MSDSRLKDTSNMPSAVRSGVTIFVLALVTVCVGQYRDENGDHGHAGEIFLYPEDPEHFHHHHHHHHHVHYHDFPSGVRPRAGDSDDGSEEQPGDDAGNFTEVSCRKIACIKRKQSSH